MADGNHPAARVADELAFLWYSWRKLQENEHSLAHYFILMTVGEHAAGKTGEQRAAGATAPAVFFRAPSLPPWSAACAAA